MDKGSVYFFDPSEIDSNESFAKQLVSSSQKISPSDTALMRRIYTLFELPKMLAFEEGGSEFSILQKELFLKTLVSNVLLAKDLGLNSGFNRVLFTRWIFSYYSKSFRE